MAASPAALVNAALAHLGQPGTITTLSTDVTPAGKAGRTFYDRARIETLKAHRWACALTQSALTLYETFADTDEREWLYRYRLPEDCLTPHRIVWGVRNPNPLQQYPFRLVADAVSTAWDIATTYDAGEYASVTTSGTVVWYRALRETVGDAPASSASDWVAIDGGPPMFLDCDREDAVLEYVYDADDPTRFTMDLESAIVALLAFYIAPIVTVNGSAGPLQANAYALWQQLIFQAQTNDYLARQRDVPPVSTYEARRITGTGYWGYRE